MIGLKSDRIFVKWISAREGGWRRKNVRVMMRRESVGIAIDGEGEESEDGRE